jgi:hypothetical protein
MAEVAGHLSLAAVASGIPNEWGRQAGAALTGDLVAGAGTELRGSGTADELCAALGRAAAGPPQRLWAIKSGVRIRGIRLEPGRGSS